MEEDHRVRAARDGDKNSLAASEHLVAANGLDHSVEEHGCGKTDVRFGVRGSGFGVRGSHFRSPIRTTRAGPRSEHDIRGPGPGAWGLLDQPLRTPDPWPLSPER